MIDYRLKPGTLHQYYALIPYGSTLAECIRDDTRLTNLLNSPGVMILGRRGKLLNLNMVAALIVEEIIKGKSSEEILETLIRNFAKNINQAMEIQQDYLGITKRLEQAGYIECQCGHISKADTCCPAEDKGTASAIEYGAAFCVRE